MATYNQAKGVFYSMVLGAFVLVGSVMTTCIASHTYQAERPHRAKFVPHTVERSIVDNGSILPRRYAKWNKASGICSRMLVEAVDLGDGRSQQTVYGKHFKCRRMLCL